MFITKHYYFMLKYIFYLYVAGTIRINFTTVLILEYIKFIFKNLLQQLHCVFWLQSR